MNDRLRVPVLDIRDLALSLFFDMPYRTEDIAQGLILAGEAVLRYERVSGLYASDSDDASVTHQDVLSKVLSSVNPQRTIPEIKSLVASTLEHYPSEHK